MEEQLKRLFQLGLVTEDEQERLIDKYRKTGIVDTIRNDFFDLVEKQIARLEAENKELNKKIAQITHRKDQRRRDFIQKIREEQRAVAHKEHETEIAAGKQAKIAEHNFFNEIKAIDRKMEEEYHQKLKKIEEIAIHRVRQKIQ